MIHYQIQIGKREQDMIKEISLYSDVNMKKRKSALIASAVMSVFSLVTGILFIRGGSVVTGIFMLLCFAFFCSVLLGIKKYQRLALDRAMKKMDGPLYSGVREYLFDENGIQVTSGIGTGSNYWNAFKQWGTILEYIYLMRIDSQIILVKVNDLAAEELAELKGLLTNHVVQKNL